MEKKSERASENDVFKIPAYLVNAMKRAANEREQSLAKFVDEFGAALLLGDTSVFNDISDDIRENRKLYVEQETYDKLEKKAGAEGTTVDLYVTELIEEKIKEAEEGEKYGSLSRN